MGDQVVHIQERISQYWLDQREYTAGVPPQRGRLIPFPVGGIGYRTATQRGHTTSRGEFCFLPGERITFFIGAIEFPATTASATVTPYDLGSMPNEPINVMRFLFSVIDERDGVLEVAPSVAQLASSPLDFAIAPATFTRQPVFDYGHLDEATIQGIVAQMESDLPAFIAGLVNNTLPESAAPQLRNWIQEQMACADPQVAIPSLESLLRWDALPSLKQLRVPLYAINASTINETARQRYRHILREHLMPEAGHFLQLEDPQGFNRALQAILDEVKLHSPAPTGSEVVV